MIFDILRKRRSIRKYKNRPIENKKMDILIETLVRSPSSRNLNPWEFIIVTNKILLDQLSKSKRHGSEFIKGAPLGIVVCGDPEKSDVWVEDCSIASILVQVVAESLHLGSCWIQIRKRMHSDLMSSESYVRKVLDIPVRLKVESIIAIGYPDEEKIPHDRELLDFNQISYDYYNCKKHD
jgi:nitroreductase